MFLLSEGGRIALIVVGVICAIFLLIVLWYIRTMNNLRQTKEKVEEAASGIDVALTKRFDALTKMMNVAKGYAKHETETLEKVVKWRGGLPANASMAEKQEFAGALSQIASGLNVIVERYPDLKADKVFGNLQSAIMDTEEQLQAARRLYNANARSLNHKVVTFPVSIVARAIKMEKAEYFEAEEHKRQDVVMEF